MNCYVCHKKVTSDLHQQQCIDTQMWCNDEQIFKSEQTFKPMMTYGLGGCTAGLMVVKEKELQKVMMIHDPNKDKVFKYLNKKIRQNYKKEIHIVIRTPGNYVKQKPYFTLKSKDHDYWMGFNQENQGVKIKIEPYDLAIRSGCRNYDRELYFVRKNNKNMYSDQLGRWVEIDG